MELPSTLTLALILLLQAGCGLLGPDPKEPELEPGRRDYTWTVDSVGNEPDMWVGWGNTIWGSSPNDVWLGLSGGHYNLWHYDGEIWAPWSYRSGADGFTGDFYSIFGFAQNDVWMGGGDGELLHFNGTEWKLFNTYQPEGFGGPNIFDIWGTSPSDIYAVGSVPPEGGGAYKGFILHYNGNKWEEVLMTDIGMQFQRIRKKNDVYIYGYGPYSTQSTSDSISFYKYKKGSLLELYSNPISKAGDPSMNVFRDKLYITLENEIKEIRNSIFKRILPFDISEDIFGINGRNAKDIFVLSANNVTHYNGEDIQKLIQLEHQDAALWSSLILENDVFFFSE